MPGRVHAVALVVTVVMNVGLLALFLQLNDVIQPFVDRASAREAVIDFVQPPPPKRRPRPKPPTRRQNLTKPPVPVPNLASSIQAPELLDPSQHGDGLLAAMMSDGLADGHDLILEQEEVDQPPEVVSRKTPIYPPRALDREIEGEVTLRILVDTDGVVREVHVLSAEPPSTFDQAAIDAVWHWRYTPAIYQGRQVRSWYRQRVLFRLR